jgi:hypothetical protein
MSLGVVDELQSRVGYRPIHCGNLVPVKQKLRGSLLPTRDNAVVELVGAEYLLVL